MNGLVHHGGLLEAMAGSPGGLAARPRAARRRREVHGTFKVNNNCELLRFALVTANCHLWLPIIMARFT